MFPAERPQEDMRVSRAATVGFILPVASRPLQSEGPGFLLGAVSQHRFSTGPVDPFRRRKASEGNDD